MRTLTCSIADGPLVVWFLPPASALGEVSISILFMPIYPKAVYNGRETSCKGISAHDIVGIIRNNRERVSPMGAAPSQPARRGRPPLKAGEAKRASFNTRLRNALKESLEESARVAGRSLSEEIESRLERSFDRTESLGGLEYEALFQMMAAAARVIEARLRKSPFSDPEASAVARNAWRQIIYNLTSDPLEAGIMKEQLRIIDEMTNLKLPSFPSLKGLALAVGYDEWVREQETYQKAIDHYDQQLIDYREKLKCLSSKALELSELANEAANTGLSFPNHR